MLHCYYEMYFMKYSVLWNNISYEKERIIKILYEYWVEQFNRQCEKQKEIIHFLPHLWEAVPSISSIKECSWLVCYCSVAKSCPTLCNPMDCTCQAPLSMEFSRQEYWSGLPFPSPGDFPDPGIEPESPTLQADSLPSEPPGKQADSAFLLDLWI